MQRRDEYIAADCECNAFYHTISRASPLACRWFLAHWTTVNRSAYYGHVVDTPSQLRERKIHRR